MADKYIRHGETFNGDGTTSAAATSNGGVGAWNTLTYFEGATPAYGSLGSGDTVYVRTLDAAGAAITRTFGVATSLGSVVGIELLPVTWVFDAGVVWPGVSGVITYTNTGAVSWTLRDSNNLLCKNYNLIITSSNTAIGNRSFLTMGNSSTHDLKTDCTATVSGAGPHVVLGGGLHVNWWHRHGGMTTVMLSAQTNTLEKTLISPRLELLGSLYYATNFCYIIGVSSGHSSTLSILGGSLTGGALSGATLLGNGNPGGVFYSSGFKFPASMNFSIATQHATRSKSVADGCDGAFGSVVYGHHAELSSRYDGFYPTLSARLGDSAATPWAYRLHTFRTTPTNPALVSIGKLWTQAAAVKTITLEILWPQSLPDPTKENVWVDIGYVDDATGDQVSQTSRVFAGGALEVSTAAWSATTYGATLFSKLKIAVTSTGSIRQDTEVSINLSVVPRAVNAAPFDIIMVCPDPVFT